MDFHIILLTLHVIGAGLILGVVLLSLFAAFRKTWSPERIATLHFIGSFGKWASVWQLLTGIGLASGEWDELGSSPIFWTKMVLYVLEGALAGMLIERRAKQLEVGAETSGFMTILLVHAILIIGIVVLGVFLVAGGHE